MATRSRRSAHQVTNWCAVAKRLEAYDRDDFTCQYCFTNLRYVGRRGITLDHIVPRSAGGDNGLTNIITACLRCNSRRRDLPLVDFVKSEDEADRIRTQAAKATRREWAKAVADSFQWELD